MLGGIFFSKKYKNFSDSLSLNLTFTMIAQSSSDVNWLFEIFSYELKYCMDERTILSVEEFDKGNSIIDRCTAIIPTTINPPIDFLLWTTFSFLLNSDPGFLHHIVFNINGPDGRTGDKTSQDQKLAFLEDLRNEKWHNRDMPISIIRVWSQRLSHSQAIDSSLCYCPTQYCVLTHDDIIVKNKSWCNQARKEFKTPNLILAYGDDYEIGYGKDKNNPSPTVVMSPMHTAYREDRRSILLNQPCNWFLVCDKPKLTQINARFRAYSTKANINEIPESVFKNQNTLPANLNYPFNTVVADIGALALDKINQSGYGITKIKSNFMIHFSMMSWLKKKEKVLPRWQHVKELEKQLEEIPSYMKLYNKHKLGINKISQMLE